MSDPPDMETLARRYLDLWQQNMTAAAADPDAARALAAFFGQLKEFGASPGSDGGRTESVDIAAALAGIDRRLGEIEQRLTALERPRRKSLAKRPATKRPAAKRPKK